MPGGMPFAHGLQAFNYLQAFGAMHITHVQRTILHADISPVCRRLILLI